MQRDLKRLAEETFDLCILGGGINGLATAYDAAQRGLKVALVEQGDFGGETSAGSLKILHGGLRYLQHLDFSRMTESIRERNALMRMAPHLVKPLGFIVPTTPGFMTGKAAMKTAMVANDLIGWKRNRGIRDREQVLPAGKIISARDLRDLTSDMPMKDTTGAAQFYDAVMRNSDRFTLSFALSASENHAVLANRVRGIRVVVENDLIQGLEVEDLEEGGAFEIKAKQYAAMTGPWRDLLPELLQPQPGSGKVVKNAGLQLLTRRGICSSSGVAIPGGEVDAEAKLKRGGRHYFSLPWQGFFLWGTQDKIYKGAPEDWCIREEDILNFIGEINESLPGFHLRREEVLFAFGGLRMMDAESRKGGSRVSRRYAVNDHQKDLKIRNLISMDGIKYTACRIMAEKATDLICQKLDLNYVSNTSQTCLAGGDYETRPILEAEIRAAVPGAWSDQTIKLIAECYGSDWYKVWGENTSIQVLPDGVTPEYFIQHAIENEMALHLEDVLLRRCPLGTFGEPSAAMIERVASIMAEALDWQSDKKEAEIAHFRQNYVYA